MAKLRIQASDGKTLVVDVTGYDPSQYDELAAAANDDYMASKVKPKLPIPAEVLNEPGLETSPLMVMPSDVKQVGQESKAGIGGIADIISGNGLDQASKDIKAIENKEEPETTAAKVGSAVGSLVTPEQIALQAGIGPLLAASGIGPWAADVMKGWGEKAALSAIGVVKNIAKGIGIENLDSLAQFVLNPIKVGKQTFEPVVQATRSTKAMLEAAQAIQDAAGKALGRISPIVDNVLQDKPEAIDLKAILESLDKMKLAVQETAPNLGKAVVNQYNAAIDDFLQVVQKSVSEPNPSLFSDLRELKTTIGNLVYKHGNPLESKAALQDAYAALSRGIDNAAKATGPDISAAFDEANAVYNKITAVVEALEGKILSGSVKSWFSDVPAIGMGILAGFGHPAAAIPTAIAAHTAQSYGPQAIAQGLGVAAKAAPTATNILARSIGAALTPAISTLNQ